MQNLISGYQELSDSLTAIANAHPDQTALVQAINGLNVQIQQAIDQQTQIKINWMKLLLPFLQPLPMLPL